MTDREYKEKYPIGTKIKYIGSRFVNSDAKKDIGKYGTVAGYWMGTGPKIYLPESSHIAYNSTSKIPVTWDTTWHNIKILSQRNEQLVFDF